MKRIVQLHNHTEYSIKKAITTVKEIVDIVSTKPEEYYPAVCITDFIAGSWSSLNKLCEKKSIKPLFALELNIEDPENKNVNYHIIAIAKNNDGIKNLIWLHNHSWENMYYVNRIKWEWIKEHSNGIIWLTGCINGKLSTLIIQNRLDEARQLIEEYKKLFWEFYIEIVINDFKIYSYVNKVLMELSKEYSIPYVVTNDSRYISKDMAESYKVWVLSGEKLKMNQKDRIKDYSMSCEELYYYNYEDYLRIANDYKHIGFALTKEEFDIGLDNTIKIAEMCNAKLDTSVKLPKFDDSWNELRKRIYKGYTDRGLNESYIPQIKKELSVIKEIGLSDYFLIIADIMQYCRDNKIMTGDRGSCGSSVVSYCLGITSFDPTKHKLLLFDRFLSADRVNPVWKDGKLYLSDPCDIDFDTASKDRDRVKEYIKNKYNQNNYAEVGNFGRAKARSCLSDISRVYDIPVEEVLSVSKMLPNILDEKALEEFSVDELKNTFIYLKDYLDKYPLVEKHLKVLIGKIRVMGHHASGVVIVDQNIDDCLPVYIRDGVKLTVWYEGVEDRELSENGIFKFDVLGLKNLSVIDDTIKLINERHNLNLTIKDIPLEDPKALELISGGDTNFIFQLESNMGKTVCRMVKPNCFEDIVLISGMVRPGPLKLGIPQRVSQRKNELVNYFMPPPVKEILGLSYGFTVYQEQQLLLCQNVGGMDAKKANKLRKLLVKVGDAKIQREEIPKYRETWDKNSFTNLRQYFESDDTTRKYCDELWKEMEAMAGYVFNKSHSTSYSQTSVREAYLKSHYYNEFMSIALSYEPIESLNKFILELKKRGKQLVKPDINESLKVFKIVDDNTFLYSLSHIKNVTDIVADEIIIKRPFTSFDDFLSKIEKKKVNKTKIESLIYCGCFDCFELDRVKLLNYYYNKIKREAVSIRASNLRELEEDLMGLSFTTKNTLYDYLCKFVSQYKGDIKFPLEIDDTTAYPIAIVGKIKKIESKKGKSGKEYVIMEITDDIRTMKLFYFMGIPGWLEKNNVCMFTVNKFKDGNSLFIERGKNNIIKLA